jgi:hypothetical protein
MVSVPVFVTAAAGTLSQKTKLPNMDGPFCGEARENAACVVFFRRNWRQAALHLKEHKSSLTRF